MGNSVKIHISKVVSYIYMLEAAAYSGKYIYTAQGNPYKSIYNYKQEAVIYKQVSIQNHIYKASMLFRAYKASKQGGG